MQLYILEYQDAYTGGSIVISAQNREELENILNSESTCAEYNVYYPEDYMWKVYMLREHTKFTPAKTDSTLTVYPQELLQKAQEMGDEDVVYLIKANWARCSIGGGVRLDWLFAVEDGLYLVAEFEINSKESRIISNTYYCA